MSSILRYTSYVKGVNAEKIAVRYLESIEYEILAQRVKTPYGEIDILCKNLETLVAVEVKYRSNKEYLRDCISDIQKRRISMAFLDIMTSHHAEEYRIDVVYLSDNDIVHMKNAFYIESCIDY